MANVRRHILRRRRRENRQRRRPRRFFPRVNPLDVYEDDEIFMRYRFYPQTILFILSLIRDRLQPATRRSEAIQPVYQLLTALRFVATGGFHLTVGDCIKLSKSSAGVCVRRVLDAIADLAPRFITFPTGNRAMEVMDSFHKIAGNYICIQSIIVNQFNNTTAKNTMYRRCLFIHTE
jgi:hypothetical protein